MGRGAADLAGPLGDIVRHSEDLLSLLVQQEMVIPKVIPSHAPVEVLGLEIKCKYIRQQSRKHIGNLCNGLAAEAALRCESLFCWSAHDCTNSLFPIWPWFPIVSLVPIGSSGSTY